MIVSCPALGSARSSSSALPSHLRAGLHDGQVAVRIDDALDVLRGAERLLHLRARLEHRGQQLPPEALVRDDPAICQQEST